MTASRARRRRRLLGIVPRQTEVGHVHRMSKAEESGWAYCECGRCENTKEHLVMFSIAQAAASGYAQKHYMDYATPTVAKE